MSKGADSEEEVGHKPATVIFECSPELKRRAREEAERRDRSLSSYIRTLLEQDLERSRQR